MIKVRSEVKIYEVDDRDVPPIGGPTLVIKSHWNERNMVNVEVDGKTYTVVASDLRAAIDNATNSNGY